MALLPRVVNEEAPGTGYTFATIGLGGTTPRIWYYALRAVDPTCEQLRRDSNSRETTTTSPTAMITNRSAKPTCIICSARLELRDLLEFPVDLSQPRNCNGKLSRNDPERDFVYKRDFLEFLAHPAARVEKARYFARDSAGWYYGYGGVNENLTGLQIDWQHRTIHYPGRVSADRRKDIENELFPNLPPDAGPRDCLSALLVWTRSSITIAARAPSSFLCACLARRCLRLTRRPN